MAASAPILAVPILATKLYIPPPPPKVVLRPRLIERLDEGRSDTEIGKTLHLEEATVRSHVHRILQRLGVENRSQVVAYANRIRRVD